MPLAFFLDPEGGFESANILPEPKLRQIDAWLEKGLEERHTASLAYRLTPYTQYPGDFYFFRRQLDPSQSRNPCSQGWGSTSAIRAREEDPVTEPGSLLQWSRWSGGGAGGGSRISTRPPRNLPPLRKPTTPSGTWPMPRPFCYGCRAGPGDQSLEGFTEDLRLRMSTMPVFRGLTLDHLWSGRARAFLQLRVENWLLRLERQAS